MTERENAKSDTSRPEDLADLDRRLNEKIQVRNSRVAKEKDREQGQAWSIAMRLSGDLIAGLFVGGGLGWLVDQATGNAPWAMLVGLGLGFAAGMLNLLRSAKEMEAKRALESADADKTTRK